MSISEDEVDHSVAYPYIQPHPGMTKAEIRKSNKPIMEKRRRARINHSLNELKSLILDAMKKDPSRHSKLEKADILEMTVKHLQSLQRHQMSAAVSADPTILAKFQTGFSECATEVTRYISRLEGVESGVKQRLLAHLSGCISGLNQIAPLASSALEDVNNNQGARALASMSGFQLSRLPTGELALLLPNSSDQQVSTTQHSGPRSAFTALQPHSPLPSPSSSTSSMMEPVNYGQEVSSTVADDMPPIVPTLPVHTPLTVLVNTKDPLDFSVKRVSHSEPLLVKCAKLPRTSEGTAFTVVEPKPRPSTSQSEPTSSSDMWRPW